MLFIVVDQAAQHTTSWNPLITSVNALDLRRAQRQFDGHVLVFGRSLGLSSQTFVMQFKNLPIAHLGYFRTDLKTGRPYALFLLRDPR